MLKCLSEYLFKIAQDPVAPAGSIETDPAELYKQIRPLLQKMGLQNMVDKSKTTLIPGLVSGKNSLYQLFLRRNSQLVKDTIERIKRNVDFLNIIQWDSKAIEVQLWWPYTPPEQTGVQPNNPPANLGAPK